MGKSNTPETKKIQNNDKIIFCGWFSLDFPDELQYKTVLGYFCG